MVTSLLKPCTRCWRHVLLFLSLGVIFGEFVFNHNYIFFAWAATWENFFTLDELQDYILLYCASTQVFWDLLFSLFDIPWVNPLGVEGILCKKRMETSIESGIFMHLLDGL